MRAWVLVLTGCGRLGFGEVTPPGDSIGDDAAITHVAINVTLAGDGVGTVTSDPPGIVCGDTCSMTVAPGTPVVLTTSHAAREKGKPDRG